MDERTPPIVLHPSTEAYSDTRGVILNLFSNGKILFPGISIPLNHVSLIYSLPGSIRGNHYHKKETHLCVIISGKCVYMEEGGQVELVPFGGVLTPPGRPHIFTFLEESLMLVFSDLPRLQEYEEDTVRLGR